ncbi:MAG TPA: branched-chain amino acid ABC transporter permease [Anaeromyxobacteraceae bacterium]|nr:branched-chain amino acid ABC transporter permease [Anaeromyxobacteraceae bacterium]
MAGLRTALRSLQPFLLAAPLLWLLQRGLDQAWTIFLVGVLVNVILAVSLNVVNGFTGQFSIGHAGFMAVGAYTAATITVALREVQILGLGPRVSDAAIFALALACGMALAALAGLLVGIPSLRLRGDYLAIVTLGFGEIIRVVIENARFLGQATGISGLPPHTTLLWVGLSAVAAVVMARRLQISTQGRALLAIREDEVAAEAMGVDTVGYKVRAFVISAAFAGLAGGLLVHQILLCTPRMFTFVKSFEVVAMVVLGGMGSITGSVVAALVLTAAPEALRAAEQYRMVTFSLLLVVLMLVRPTGLLGSRELWDLLPPLRRRVGGSAT